MLLGHCRDPVSSLVRGGLRVLTSFVVYTQPCSPSCECIDRPGIGAQLTLPIPSILLKAFLASGNGIALGMSVLVGKNGGQTA